MCVCVPDFCCSSRRGRCHMIVCPVGGPTLGPCDPGDRIRAACEERATSMLCQGLPLCRTITVFFLTEEASSSWRCNEPRGTRDSPSPSSTSLPSKCFPRLLHPPSIASPPGVKKKELRRSQSHQPPLVRWWVRTTI